MLIKLKKFIKCPQITHIAPNMPFGGADFASLNP
jgi:hypothetical protein